MRTWCELRGIAAEQERELSERVRDVHEIGEA